MTYILSCTFCPTITSLIRKKAAMISHCSQTIIMLYLQYHHLRLYALRPSISTSLPRLNYTVLLYYTDTFFDNRSICLIYSYLISTKVKPLAGAVGPASPLFRLSSAFFTHSGSNRPFPTAIKVPAIIRTIL